ncbi:MAG: NAD-dependent epimerase/dehydratase family protein [Gemmataceae bacterium]|nr:NAD-dependent epimerase/dehydratase family protein [Gemmataceae bacterium]
MIRHLQPAPALRGRVVVLGASGFVGRDLMDHLSSLGVETLGLSSRNVNLLEASSVERLQSLLRKDDTLVFASAITPDRGRDTRALMRNLSMGEHVAAVLEKTPLAHVAYISSDAVYADDAGLLRETTPTAPDTLYGLMHVTRERMLALAAQKSQTPFLVLRPVALYGPADTHNSYGPNRFLRSARGDGKIRLFGDGEEKRDHVYIRDFTRLLGQCLLRRSIGTLNVAAGRAVSFAVLARTITKLCERPVCIDCQERNAPITHRHFEISALLQAFPSFAFTPLHEALAMTAGQLAAAA